MYRCGLYTSRSYPAKADKANNEEKLIFDDKKTDKVDSFEQVKKKTNLDYDDIQALNKFDSLFIQLQF